MDILTIPLRSTHPTTHAVLFLAQFSRSVAPARPRDGVRSVHPWRVMPQLRRRLALALVLVTACRGAAAAPPVPDDRPLLALSPVSFAGSLSVQQRVHVERDGRIVDFDAVLEVSPDMVTLVALGFGTRLFTLRYDGTKLDEARSPMLPRDVRGSDILSDMQLSLWPADAVRAALPSGWSLRDAPNARTLLKGADEITNITYDTMPRWKGKVTLQNHQFGYRLVITTVPENK
jgi:hypothetical protein